MATKTFKIGLSNTDKQNMAQDVYERLIAMCFDEYDSSETYNKGDFVVYENPSDTFKLYKCNSDNVTGAWDGSKWDLTTFQDLVDDIESAVAFVNDKANVDGNYPTMTVGVADQLSPYDENSGDDQDDPFSFQATGTGNGSQPDFSTGSIALMKEKQGNSVVVNQKMSSFNSQSDGGISLTSNQDGSVTLNGNANQGYSVSLYPSITQLPVLNHTYYFDANCNDENVVIEISGYTLSRKNKGIVVNTFTNQQQLILKVVAGAVLDNVKAKPIVIDLTQMFNGDIPLDLLDNPKNFFRYYQGSLAYNEGTLVNANSQYIKCIGRNQWDEETEAGNYNTTTGEKQSGAGLRCKNPIKVIPNTTYYCKSTDACWAMLYDKDGNVIATPNIVDVARQYDNASNIIGQTFTIPENCLYIAFYLPNSYGASYKHDTTISIYYEGESGYDQYYPYEVLTNTDTGTEVLRSAGNVKDYKTPDGVVHRKLIDVDLGSLTWVKGSTTFYVSGFASANGVKQPSNAEVLLILSSVNMIPKSEASVSGNKSTNEVYISSSGGLIWAAPYDDYVDGAALKTALNGKHAIFELAEPTTEQGTSYSENLIIDDFGSMDFQGTNGVPQGNLIFYPVDYKAFVDTLYDYADGTPSKLAKKTDLPTAPDTYLTSLTGYDATKTQTLKNVNGVLTWVDDE